MLIEKVDIEIPPDLESFKVEIVGGLTYKQFFSIVIMFIVAVGVYFGVGQIPFLINIRLYLIFFSCLPIMMIGFYEYEGYSGYEYFKMLFKFNTTNQIVIYKDYTLEEMLEGEI